MTHGPSTGPEIAPQQREIPSLREAKISLSELRSEVENTRLQNFLAKKSFDLEIENRIDGMKFLPTMPHRRAIYERMLFGQRNGIKIVLQVEMAKFIKSEPGASDAKLDKTAREIIEACFSQLLALDKNGDKQLNYKELIPENFAEKDFVERVFGTAPFFVAMENNKFFKNPEIGTEGHPEVDVEGDARSVFERERIEFVKNYIIEFSETLLDPKTQEPVRGSGRELARLLQTISLSVVGGRFLKNEAFAKTWNELLGQGGVVSKVFAEGEQKEQKKFGRLLEKDDIAIQRMRVEADEIQAEMLELEKTNKHGHLLRKFGDLKSIILYYGSNLLLVTIGMNAVLSGFNPEKMLKNPVMWGMAGLIYAAKKHLDPESFRGASPAEKDSRESLKQKFISAPPAVRDWLVKFKKSDLAPDSKLGKLLAQKNRSEITSEELNPLVKADERPTSTVVTNTNEARKLFLFFRACQQRDLSPKKLLDA